MSALIFGLVILAVALTLGLVALEDPGYVLISRSPYEIEISLALLVLGILLLLVLLYVLVRLASRTFRAPRDLGRWRAQRRHALADQATLSGYARLIEGEWEEAEMVLSKRLGQGSTPLLQCLGAAYAAQQRNDLDARDRYLTRARDCDPAHLVAVEITRARLLERAGQTDEARGVLEQLHEQGVHRHAVQGMLAHLLKAQQDWPALEKLLVETKRSGALPRAELAALRQELQTHRLGTEGEGGGLSVHWSRLSRRERRNPLLQGVHARGLINAGEMDEAERFLRKALRRRWDGELVRLYGHVRSSRMEEQLRHAEQWAANHQEDPDLLMTLARLYLENHDRDKARSHLLEAVRRGGSREGYLELGLLLESMGESDKALQCYRRGLQAQKSTPVEKIPRLQAERATELVPVLGPGDQS